MTNDVSRTEVAPVEITLRDGRRATVRPIREDDAERLQDAIRALSMESSYARFFSPFRELPKQLLKRAIHPEPGRELQLVVISRQGGDEKIIAGARYGALPGAGDCEFAVAVVDAWHRQGLARRLMEMLLPHARAAGFERMEGYVLATNTRMLTLAKQLGFTESASSEGPSVRMVRRELRTLGS